MKIRFRKFGKNFITILVMISQIVPGVIAAVKSARTPPSG